MNSLKLQTATGVYREIDLIDYAIVRSNADRVFDSIIETQDGTQTLYQRAQRKSFAVALDGIPATYVETLRQIFNERQELFFEANVGQYTTLYHPFEASKDPLIGSIGMFARASVATYLGSDGKIHEALAGIPRYEAGKLGNGIVLEMARTNYFYPSHPTSGATIWTSQAGTPVIAFDTKIVSNVYGKTGAVRLELSSTTPDVVKATISGLASSTAHSCFVWVCGVGSIELTVTSATGTTASGTVTLSMAWQQVSVEGFTTTGTSVEMRITAKSLNTRCWLSAHQLEAGSALSSYIPAPSAATVRAMDQWAQASATMNYAEGSIAMWLRFPRITLGADGNRFIWLLASNFWAAIDQNATLVFTTAPGVGLSIAQATHGLTAGTLAHVAFVWKRDYIAVVINGVVIASSSSNVRDSGSPSSFNLYSATSTSNALIDDLRLDDRYVEWSTASSGLYAKRYSTSAGLALCRLTQGRRFRIKGAEFSPREADPAYCDGTLTIEEASSSAYYTCGAK